MEEDIKNEWVKRLRSGEYEQAQEILFDPECNAYCCLGVLCEIAREEGVVTRDDNEYVWQTYDKNWDAEWYELPSPVQKWAGISSPDVELPETFRRERSMHCSSLVALNDEFDYDFNSIADVIDKYWKDF